MQSPAQLHPHAHLVGCLSSDQKLLNSLLKEAGWGERHKAEGDGDKVTLPIEWVVDIADKDGDWFIGTATGYNDAKQSLHVMVPDRDAPTWTGDVSVNPLVRPCCVRPTILHACIVWSLYRIQDCEIGVFFRRDPPLTTVWLFLSACLPSSYQTTC